MPTAKSLISGWPVPNVVTETTHPLMALRIARPIPNLPDFDQDFSHSPLDLRSPVSGTLAEQKWQGSRRCSSTDDDPVVDFRHPGCPPGGPFGFLPLSPRAHYPREDDFSALHLDSDAVCVDLGAA